MKAAREVTDLPARARSVVGTKSHPALVGEEKWRSNRTPISQSSGFQVGISFSIPSITYRLLDSLADTLSPSHVATLKRALKSATPRLPAFLVTADPIQIISPQRHIIQRV